MYEYVLSSFSLCFFLSFLFFFPLSFFFPFLFIFLLYFLTCICLSTTVCQTLFCILEIQKLYNLIGRKRHIIKYAVKG